MDCEKFDKVALEMLYDELDELTSAAARRHMDHCSRCGSVGAKLRATREVGVLPMLTPPADLEAKILKLEREARQALPFRERVGRAISVLAGYAMRPQLAMAALLVLMIGSSFLFLRSKPGDADSVHVTERGIREADESVAIVPVPEAPATLEAKATPRTAPVEPRSASGSGPPRIAPSKESAEHDETQLGALAAPETEETEGAYDRAMSAYRRGDYAVAQQQFESIAAEGGEQAPAANLYAAHAARNSLGCEQAAPKFDAVTTKFPASNVAQEATWQAATCYRSLGQLELARARYQRLLDAPAYVDRAQHALAHLSRPAAEVVASRRAEPAPAKAVPKAKASKPAASSADSTKKATTKASQ